MTKRPGGLTVLGILNFVFAGFAVIGALVYLVAVFNESGRADMKLDKFTTNQLSVVVAISLFSAGLAITSGVGYFKQSFVWGRVVGTIYALVDLSSSIFMIVSMEKFQILSLIGFVYPVLTLFLLNITFKYNFFKPGDPAAEASDHV